MKPIVFCVLKLNDYPTFLDKYSKVKLKASKKDGVNNNITELRKIADVGVYSLNETDIDSLINEFNNDIDNHQGAIINLASKKLDNIEEYLKKIYDKVISLEGELILVINHPNKETSCIITTNKKIRKGNLIDIVPTMLDLMGIKKPKTIKGLSLIKKRSKSDIFIVASAAIMFALILTYGIRFIHYYKIEHTGVMVENTLVSRILANNKLVSKDGLVSNNDYYVFKGNVNNNYVLYSGYLFRIVGINKDNSIKLVTDDITTSLVWGYDNNYKKSYVKKYLEDNFYKTLVDPDTYLVNSTWCIDEINKKYNTCNKKNKGKVGLLTYNDYMNANANNSYLNINKYWWTMNASKNNKVWYVFNEGGINNDSKTESTYYSFGVRPSININPKTNYTAGSGTKEDPYIIGDNSEIKIGSYLNYSGYTWKVISKGETLKLVMSDCLKENEECKTYNFARGITEYNEYKSGSLAYYLNNNFYYTLDRTHLVKSTWYIGKYNLESKYDYNNIFSESMEADVGILNVLENNIPNTFTLTPSGDELLYSLKEDGTLYETDPREELNIYPSINIDLNYKITGGTGTLDNPFIIE